MRTPPAARPRNERRRRPNNHQVAIAYTVWGVLAVGIAVFGWVAADLFRAETVPTAKPAPQVLAKAPAARSNAEADAEAARFTAEILKRDRERRQSRAKEREAEILKREAEILKREVERLKDEAARRPPSVPLPVAVAAAAPKPEPVAPKPQTVAPKPEPFERQREEEARKHEVVRDLFERALALRAARDPEKLLDVLLKLKKLRPADPTIHFGLGEVYSSFGVHFNLAKARSAFRRFLSLTTKKKFDVTSLHRLSSLRGRDLQDLRLTVQHHLVLLGKKHRLLLVTSPSTIARLQAGLEKELKARNGVISTSRSWILTHENRINSWRRSRSFDRNSQIRAEKRHIRNLRKQIAREEAQIKFVTAELARLREANRQR